jgi:hypothetical protein
VKEIFVPLTVIAEDGTFPMKHELLVIVELKVT